MPVTSDDWAPAMDRWKEHQGSPWGRLRYSISRRNIARHLGGPPLRVLDAGGGNGLDSIHYAQQGHSVTLVDNSAGMLAEARKTADEEGVAGRLTIRQSDVGALRNLCGDQRFDLILCHSMIEFVSDAQALLREVCELLAPGGFLSLLEVNRHSEAYRLAFQADDLADAIKAVGAREYFHPCVNRLTPRFSADEFIDRLQENGCSLAGHYGVHCLWYYLPSERKTDPQYCAELEKLEHRLTDTYPYHLLARFYQVIAQKM